MTTGTVKFFNVDKGYGFIAPNDGGTDAFVHISAVERAGMRTLEKDQRVSYELETDRRGKVSAPPPPHTASVATCQIDIAGGRKCLIRKIARS